MSAPSSAESASDSTAAIKLPMPIRKEIRDKEADKTKALAELSKLLGHPVTFEFDLPAVYATLASVPTIQPLIVSGSLNKLQAVLRAVKKFIESGSGGVADDTIRDELNALWHTHIYRVTVVDKAEWAQRMKEDTTIKVLELHGPAWSLIEQGKATIGDPNRHRTFLQAGVLETVCIADSFNAGINLEDNFRVIALTGDSKLDATPGDARLPLHLRFELSKHRAAWDAALQRINALPGLEDATFDFDATLRRCYDATRVPSKAPIKSPFTVERAVTYIVGLSKMLTRDWKDEMVRVGILEQWTAPHTIELVGVVGSAEVKAEKAKDPRMVVDRDGVCGVRLAGAVLQIVMAQSMWGSGGGVADIKLESIL